MGITFLNLALLSGLAFAAAPVIIHLINRYRYKTVYWGAMQFLETSLVTSARRLQLEQIILLLIRTALLLLLALAFARPFVDALPARVGTPTTKRNVVIIMDNSMSMSMGEEALSRFTGAKKLAGKLIEQLTEGDTVNIVSACGDAKPLLPDPTFDFGKAEKALQNLRISCEQTDFVRAFLRALRQLEKSHNPSREIYVVTDEQDQGWYPGNSGRWLPVTALLEERSRPRIFVLPVVSAGAENAAITAVSLSRQVVGTDRPVRLDVRITNYGAQPRKELNVSLAIDGLRIDSTKLDIGAGKSVSPSFSHHFEKPGSHHLEIQIDPDSLTRDDRMLHSLDVLEAVPVLCVDGDPSDVSFAGETDFLTLALEPRDRDRSELQSLVRPTVMPISALPTATFADYQAVILANCPAPGDDVVAELERYVELGGGVIFFPGDQVEPRVYNSKLYRDARGLLPCRLLPPQGDETDRSTFAAIVASTFAHPALKPFSDPKEGDLSRAHIYKWFPARIKRDPLIRVLCKLDNGLPFLIERRFGQGVAMLMASPIDADWSDLPLKPFYLPLVHQLVYYLAASSQPPVNVRVGDPFSKFLSLDQQAAKVRVEDPSGRRFPIVHARKGNRRVATYEKTLTPGLYAMEVTDKGRPELSYFVVDVDRGESDLQTLDETKRRELSEAPGIVFTKGWEDLQGNLQETKLGREVWQPVVLAILLLLALESFLTRRWCEREAEKRVSAASAFFSEPDGESE